MDSTKLWHNATEEEKAYANQKLESFRQLPETSLKYRLLSGWPDNVIAAFREHQDGERQPR